MNYRLAYWLGFHPWEDAATDAPFAAKISEIFDREESGREPPYGQALDIGTGSGIWGVELAKRGSLFLTRPILFHYIARRADLERAARELFEVIGQGVVRIEIGQSYALQDVAQAHRDLEARRTVGSTVLIP